MTSLDEIGLEPVRPASPYASMYTREARKPRHETLEDLGLEPVEANTSEPASAAPPSPYAAMYTREHDKAPPRRQPLPTGLSPETRRLIRRTIRGDEGYSDTIYEDRGGVAVGFLKLDCKFLADLTPILRD